MPLSQTSHEGEVISRTNRALTLSKVTSSPALLQNNVSAPEGCLVLDDMFSEFIPWDNPDNIISQETEQAVDTAIGAVCLPILFLISVPGNILNMLVFWKQGLKERINLCLFCLSLVDFLHMLNSFFVNVDRLYPPFTQAVGPVLKFIIEHKLIGLRAFTWLSGFISMFIACERCLCVVSPLRSQTILTNRTTAVILMMTTVLTLTGNMIIGLRWSLDCVFNPVTNTTSTVMHTSQFYEQNRAHLDFMTMLVTAFQPLTYVTVITGTTIVTSVMLKKMVTWREKSSSSKPTGSLREMALTRTLIAVSILYIICSVPALVLGVGVMCVPDMGLSGRYYNLARFVLSFIEFASFINATFNFFVYCILGSKYRETLRLVLHCSSLKPCPDR